MGSSQARRSTSAHARRIEAGLVGRNAAIYLLGPFYGAIAVPSVTRCRCYRHRRRDIDAQAACASGGVRQ